MNNKVKKYIQSRVKSKLAEAVQYPKSVLSPQNYRKLDQVTKFNYWDFPKELANYMSYITRIAPSLVPKIQEVFFKAMDMFDAWYNLHNNEDRDMDKLHILEMQMEGILSWYEDLLFKLMREKGMSLADLDSWNPRDEMKVSPLGIKLDSSHRR